MLEGSYLHRLAQIYADREKALVDVLLIFRARYQCESHPTYAQFVSFVYDAEAAGYSLKNLYRIFASGNIPADLDQLIRQHAEQRGINR